MYHRYLAVLAQSLSHENNLIEAVGNAKSPMLVLRPGNLPKLQWARDNDGALRPAKHLVKLETDIKIDVGFVDPQSRSSSQY